MRRSVTRLAALSLLAALPGVPFAAEPQPGFVQAVEFAYYAYPRALWERELVWLKNIGVQTVEFSIPWNFHQIQPGEFDFTGRTSPRRDLMAFIRLLRRLEMRAWIRPLQTIPGFINDGLPSPGTGGSGPGGEQVWLKQLDSLLATQTANHGGPIAWVEGRAGFLGMPAPPEPINRLSANQPAAVVHSRASIAAAHGSLLWTDVEDTLYPAGWAATPATLLRKGAVSLNGDERPTTSALRRDAALLRSWSPLFSELRPAAMPKPLAGKLPEGVTAVELVSPAASAICIANSGVKPFHDDLRVFEPLSKRIMVIPGVSVGPGESLWLPLGLSLSPDGLCRDCIVFAPAERIVYATAELLSVEFENGLLAMEFAAPEPGEVILQLARKPVGPFLAAGRPTGFDWDVQSLRARLKIPAGKSADKHVRIGLAIEAPETSAFFNEAKRLVIGRKNTVSTVYSSEDVAKRSRLRLPEGFTATPTVKSPNEIDYEIAVPPEAAHGDYANLALEADGVRLGRARLQLFRPASIRVVQAMQLHFGSAAELTPDPSTAPIEPKGGANLEFAIRNNTPGIQTYHLEVSGKGLEFLPAKTDISVAAMEERRVEIRVFAAALSGNAAAPAGDAARPAGNAAAPAGDAAVPAGNAEGDTGLRDFRLRVSNGADHDVPVRVLLVPRGRTVVWSADLDGDGYPEWILESPKVRAVFSEQDGGRWMEFTWKDTNVNFFPEGGVFAAPGPVEVQTHGNSLEFQGKDSQGKDWKRTVSLSDTTLTVDQTTPLPAAAPAPEKRGNTSLSVTHPSPTRAVYTLQ
ncbi:MAG TPA: beta-galactosidase [Candidatus Acidoferrales bacterium]|nr:beta-galactosidase [Candidatus Acidoferrales bacterium]